MATLSETMTLAGFSARVAAGTLNIGQIYTITDKGWVLQAHTNTVAKPLHGAFKIMNGESLPDGIIPDEIIIDSGSITTDANDPVNIISPVGYIFSGLIYLNALSADENEFYIHPQGDSAPLYTVNVWYQGIYKVEYGGLGSKIITQLAYSAPGVSGDGYRALFYFKKSGF